ncbi:MAG TPA: MFS transporter [Steroidobacter sp.]|nr:MFS transporter [Steroidobacter sp.]
MPAHVTPNSPVDRQDFSLLQMAALVFVVCTGFSSQMVMPLWIGAIIDDYGMSRSVAGSIGAAEMAVVAVVSFALAIRVHRFKARSTVMVGLVCLICGNLLAAFMKDPAALTAARVLVGCGKGIVVTISFSLAAGTSHPIRAFAVLNASYALFSTAFFLVMPAVIAAGGASGCFAVLSAVSVISLLAMTRYPERRMQGTDMHRMSFRDIQGYGLIAFAALIVLWIGHNAIWTFVERIGLGLDFTAAQIGQVLSVAAFITICGPSLARVIDTRFGHTQPVLAAISLKVVITLLLVYTTSQWMYAALVPAFMLLALFMLPYFQGILSLADPAGRLAAAASAAMTMGSSLGSLLGGWTADTFDYEGLGWVAATSFAIVIVMVAMITRRLGNSSTQAAPVLETQREAG